ncbi:MAG: TadE/TadG family type IV pilus assembly protein, partial [Myxococcales bacterium]
MMYHRYRRIMRDERGHAIVIGAVGLLIMAVMVTISLSIGNGVYQKIKLQDAADAQAYTNAVKMAKAYNFFAYTNRAMVVHYCAMLTLLSYVSHAFYLNETIARAASVLKYIPYIGAIFAVVENAIKIWYRLVDGIAMLLIPLLDLINIGLWLVQEAVLTATWMDLYVTQGNSVAVQTDRKAVVNGMNQSGLAGVGMFTLNHMNASDFLHPISDAMIGLNPGTDPTGLQTRVKLLSKNRLSDPIMANYRFAMGNIVNSARQEWTAIGKGPILIGRRWSLGLCLLIGKVEIQKNADSQLKSFHEQFENNPKDQLFAADDIRIRVRAPGCWWPAKWKTVFQYNIRIAADSNRGWHQSGAGKNNKHHMFMGITPFVYSRPSFTRPEMNHFNQPCNVVLATKDMTAQRKVFEMRFRFMEGKGRLARNGRMDATWAGNTAPFVRATGGMAAFAAGRAIYHRPGRWKEEPNFFNPLWEARLIPVLT